MLLGLINWYGQWRVKESLQKAGIHCPHDERKEDSTSCWSAWLGTTDSHWLLSSKIEKRQMKNHTLFLHSCCCGGKQGFNSFHSWSRVGSHCLSDYCASLVGITGFSVCLFVCLFQSRGKWEQRQNTGTMTSTSETNSNSMLSDLIHRDSIR